MKMVGEAIEYLEKVNLISISVRILMSMICGGLIGIERGRSNQPAGMRTYMLVCMGAAVVMMTGQYMYDHFQTGDPARLGAQVISGIGFLGAGSIITFGKTKIKGLTTAAGLWTAACIGLSIGIGFYIAGIISTLAVSLIMTQFKKLEYRLIIDDVWLSVYMEMDDTAKMADIAREIAGVGLEIDEVQIGKKRKGFQKAVINLKNTEHRGRDEVLKYLENMESIQFVKYTS
ncbi:MgtC/SapB family protein [Clostridium sp. WB02_MRS01]|uniref:MgtC/SapB family protein n=1 Tax=Clostridium sp. WB02_MRS01 TaxID=2605777 RepID=UPI0012B2E18B|nr:MgtC/SapB family protein [Clostridium sp. WB02_MRS01]MSS07191.1 MgtC/SapB family protein [Clostridium sp. WB02_MRS01]